MKVTVRSNWAAPWSESTVPVTRLPAGTARSPRMSEGGSPAPTIECSAEVAGVSWTTLPPGMVIRWTDRVVVFPEVSARPALNEP